MAYQETTRQSYGSKVKGSFQGILWGIVLIIAGTIVLWWNEGRAVKASNALKDFQKNYVELSDINTIDGDFEGKAIHATGVATTDEILRDPAFGIAVNAFRLSRDVEYYQWIEHSSSESKDKLGGATETTTTYTYEPGWASDPVNSAEFKDPEYKGKNFVWRVVEDVDQYAANATFGAYRLTEGIIKAISGEEPAQPSLTEEQQKQLLAKVTDSTVVVTVRGNEVYIGADPDYPHVGDVRITFNQVTSPKTISLLQKVVNGTFESYIAKNGKSFSKVEMGTVSAMNMIEHQKGSNRVTLWLLRILGIILVVGGFRSLLSIISTVFAVVPFVQKIIGTGVGLVTTLVGLVWSLVVIALAWVAYRPALAISLLVLAAALIIWLVSRSRKKKRSDVAVLLAICLMVGLAGCTGGASNGNNESGDGAPVAASIVKGPVKTVKLTQFYGEGGPEVSIFEYDEKGNLVSQTESYFEGVDESYTLIESLSEKDAQDRYTKEVWGMDGVPDQITEYEYNDNGNITKAEAHQADGTWNYTTVNRYDTDGRQIMSTHRSPYGESVSVYEYDAQGRQVKSTYTSNGQVFSISETAYDAENRPCYRKETFPQMNRINETYTTYDKKGEMNGNRMYVTDGEGSRLENSDSLFTDSKGLLHERQYNCYGEGPKTFEGTFNENHYLTHYEYFEGTANNPSVIIDLNYEKDGRTLRDITWSDLSFGAVKNSRTRSFEARYDTFGNWIRRTSGIPYLFDAQFTKIENIDDMVTESYREITYRGEDQGQNYGFEGKVGNAEIRLTCTEDNDVFCGILSVDGNPWRTVGTRDENGNLFFVALEEEGDIPWSLSIPAGNGKRTAALYDMRDKDPEPVEVMLNPTRKELKTYRFGTSSAELAGLYRYNFKDGSTSGQLDVSRCGDDWQDVHFEIENVWYGNSPKVADDVETQFGGDDTDFFIYKYDDLSESNIEYSIRFFDGFAVIRVNKGNPNDFFPIGTTIGGIYAKLPSVG